MPSPAAGRGLLLLWQWLNSRTSVLTGTEGRKLTYELDSDAGDLGFNTDFLLYGGRICQDDQRCLKFLGSSNTNFKQVLTRLTSRGGFSFPFLPNFMKSPGPAGGRHQLTLICHKNMRRKAGSTQAVQLSCYICAPAAARKNHVTYPQASAAWILSLQHCHRSLVLH